MNEKCSGKYKIATFTDDDALLDLPNILKFSEMEMKEQDPFIGCLKGNPINHNFAPYDGKYYLWNNIWPDIYKEWLHRYLIVGAMDVAWKKLSVQVEIETLNFRAT